MASSTYSHKPQFDTRIDFELGAWKVGRKLSSKIRKQEDPQGGFTYERHEDFEATRVDQPLNTPDVIKVKKQITFWSNHRYSEPSDGVYREIYNLSQLEDCRRIAKLLGYAIKRQDSSDELPGGYIAYIVMQKVPGENLHGFDNFQERSKTVFELPSLKRYGNCSPAISLIGIHEEKILYGSPKVDNDVEQHTDRAKDDVCLDAMEQLEYWGLIEGQYEGVFFEKDKLLEDLKVQLYSE
ncbi:hypothetical protein BO83DRAFT_438202 [Aspergillus eucalypticola CBS 122712]|uniref:Uncharacterized protein n=1 Tax=Aspergillus eucalypticola (strain CBS 122712 / IBT 29274) TaxID=1448314 RepID=A0A317VBK2_ASPEC|nr:uncharacterized protein BO83DRAFT_438202 [Aspergillus eucalypticola CBS 122712]PWY71405.1 hypothetical protein BO83DRAFT_438202 [Aspergillus eucalypticola CBS 122712]